MRSSDAVERMANMVEGIKDDLYDMKGDVGEIRDNLDKIMDDLDEIKDGMGDIKDDFGEIKDDVVEIKCPCSATPLPPYWRLNSASGNQIEQDVRKWFSPPDPSVNYNIACEAHQKGTAVWFFQGSIFKEWELVDSLLWIHGKRASPLSFTVQLQAAQILVSIAGSGKSILRFVISYYPQVRELID